MKKHIDIKKAVSGTSFITLWVIALSLFSSEVQAQQKGTAETTKKPQGQQAGGSRTETSYTANYYYLYNKEGDSQGEKGELKASSTAITLKTNDDALKLTFKINETPAFQVFKGYNGDPTFYGENTTWSRFVAAGQFAFFGGNKGLSTADVPNLFVATDGKIGVNTSSPAYQFHVSTPNNQFGMVHSAGSVKIGTYIGADYAAIGTLTGSKLHFYVNNSAKATIGTDGNFGIGTMTPFTKLDVSGGDIRTSGSLLIGNNNGVTTGDVKRIKFTSDDYHYIYSSGSGGNNLYFGEYLSNNPNSAFHWINTTNNQDVMVLNGAGNLGIGTSTPSQKLQVQGNTYLNGKVGIGSDLAGISSTNLENYNLFVEKGILTENYELGPRSSWADYVFESSYRLNDLNYTENYIKKYGHLPGIPSASQIAKEGYSLHDMNVKLLAKIEELTLYAIQQDKTITELKEQAGKYQALEKKIALLEKILEQKK